MGRRIENMVDRCRENVIEFLEGKQCATVTFSQGRYKNRIKKLTERHPEECQIVAQNKDGTLCAHIPVKWIKIIPSQQLTKAQQEKKAKVLLRNLEKRRL